MVEISASTLMVLNLVIAMFAMMVIYAIGYRKVPPNKVMIRKRRMDPEGFIYQFIAGGGVFIIPGSRKPDVLSLEAKLLRFQLSDIRTTHDGEPRKAFVDISTVYKISSDEEMLKQAAENLTGKTDDEIAGIARVKLEEGLRRLFSDKDFKEVAPNRDTASANIQWIGQNDLAEMGFELRTFHYHDIRLGGEGRCRRYLRERRWWCTVARHDLGMAALDIGYSPRTTGRPCRLSSHMHS